MQAETSVTIKLTASLSDDGRLAAERGVPLVVLVSQTGCPFCRALRQRILLPILRRPEAGQRLYLVELSIDAGRQVEDFDGETVPAAALAARYEAYVTPTVLFLDASGKEMGAPLSGTPNLELYSYYFNQRIDEALRRLRSGQKRQV